MRGGCKNIFPTYEILYSGEKENNIELLCDGGNGSRGYVICVNLAPMCQKHTSNQLLEYINFVKRYQTALYSVQNPGQFVGPEKNNLKQF